MFDVRRVRWVQPEAARAEEVAAQVAGYVQALGLQSIWQGIDVAALKAQGYVIRGLVVTYPVLPR